MPPDERMSASPAAVGKTAQTKRTLAMMKAFPSVIGEQDKNVLAPGRHLSLALAEAWGIRWTSSFWSWMGLTRALFFRSTGLTGSR